MNVVVNSEYIERLAMVIRQLHKCNPQHTGSVHVHETFQGQIVWDGDVQIFKVLDHPKTRVCYAWSYQDDSGEKIATILAMPPVTSALDAVRLHIVAEAKKRQGK